MHNQSNQSMEQTLQNNTIDRGEGAIFKTSYDELRKNLGKV